MRSGIGSSSLGGMVWMVHRAAVEHIVRSVCGAVNNHYPGGVARIEFAGRVPDVVVRDGEGRITEVYEVEVLHKEGLPKREGLKRILVIALEDADWDEVKLLTDDGKGIMERVSLDNQVLSASAAQLKVLNHKIEVQKSRLKGYNTRIGRKLSLAKEKKRVDEGWE